MATIRCAPCGLGILGFCGPRDAVFSSIVYQFLGLWPTESNWCSCVKKEETITCHVLSYMWLAKNLTI